MTTPIDVSEFSITERGRDINFPYTLGQVSLWNSGPDNVKVKMGNSGFHTLKKSEGWDIESPYGINELYAKTDSGTSNLRFTGTRKFISNSEEPIRIIQENTEKPINIDKTKYYYIPYQNEVNQTSQNNYFPFLILIGIIAIVGITAMVIMKE